MRIIAGDRKGFTLKIPHGQRTRPTLARVRESLFSILSGRVIDATVVDLYAGCGALGLEALSRGATHCTFVDHAHGALACLRDNVAKLGFDDCTDIHHDDVLRWVRRDHAASAPFDLVFLDPPYDTGAGTRALEAVESHLPMQPSALVVLQCSTREAVPQRCGRLTPVRDQRYGDTAVHLYRLDDAEKPTVRTDERPGGNHAQDRA